MSFAERVKTQSADSSSIDAFGRQRVSNPTTLFDSSFLYDKQPLIFEESTTGGATATHDSINSAVTLSTSGTGTEEAVLQSYRRPRYKPGKSHLVVITFKFGPKVAGVTKEVGLNDELDGILLQQSGTTVNIIRRSSTDVGTATIPQASWNIDPMDGTGPSGITLDLTKAQILYMDMQWLGVGRVRVGFDIDGIIYYVHEFQHSNVVTAPYTESMVLPIRYRISSVESTGSMDAICSSVQSEGGAEEQVGYTFNQSVLNVTSAVTTRTHAISIRPKTLFNSQKNTNEFTIRDLSLFAINDQPIYWELVIGATLTTPNWIDVNNSYSATEYDTTGTFDNLTGGIVIKSGFLAGTNKDGVSLSSDVSLLYPLTLDKDGNNRELGTLTLLVQSLGASPGDVDAVIGWVELR